MSTTGQQGSVGKFSMSSPQYDQTTFSGRLRHFMDLSDPRTLLPAYFFGMSVEQSKTLLAQYQSNTLPPTTTESDLWLAKKIKTAIVHPDTEESIPAPFRMSGFAVFGSPIMVGLLLPNPSLGATIFWQSLNQTHNSCVNYANKNKSKPTTNQQIIEGYLGAVVSSVSIAVGLKEAVKRINISPNVRAVVSRFVPYPAVATASTCNMLLMRRGELDSGINVVGDDGKVYGISKVAAKQALFETAVTRVVLPAPLLLLPPICMMAVEATPLLKVAPRLSLPLNAFFCFWSFVFGLPLAISVFPQEGRIPVQQLEPEFHHLVDANGQPIASLKYNKGL